MKEVAAFFFGTLSLIAILLGLGWLIQGNQFFMYRYFAPQYANVQRQIFEQTAPYNEGMMQDLRRMQEEYLGADKDHKAGIGALIIQNYASYDEGRMPSDLRAFYDQVKSDQGVN